MTQTSDEYRELLTLMRQMEERLSKTISTGLSAMNLSIATLADQQHINALAQAEKNATFANRDRVEAVSSRVHDLSNIVQTQELRLARVEVGCKELQTQSSSVLEMLNDRSLKLMSGTSGYLISAILVFVSIVTTYLLSHSHP